MSIVQKLDKPEQFETILKENASRLVVVFFSASWSDECKLMSNVVDELSKQLTSEKKSDQVRFVHVEAEENEDLCVKSGIESVPSFLFIKSGGQVLSKLSGAEPSELRKRISQYVQTISSSTGTSGGENNKEASLNDRLKKLITQAPVVLFMKGSPQEPRCGFSRQIIEILNNQNVKFSHFDILSDNDVREGLKKYSNWPTYPQLYAKGELVGGLDIVKELIQSGEFESVMPKPEESLNERLKKLINRAKCMLFMKGNAKEPRCGFSRQIIEIMNETGVKYDTFDILSDEEVRQGLKEYSKWPTYPQVYVDGELVGGLDILKELKQSGELIETLKGKQ